MNKKNIFIGVAILALLVQILFPTWWLMVAWSVYFFLVEGIIEGGLFQSGYYLAYSIAPWMILFFFYWIVALVSVIWSFFAVKGIESDQIYLRKKNVFFMIINVVTIVLSIIVVIVNKGFLPRL